MAGVNNTTLSCFITSLGSLNGYDSKVYQTKQALHQHFKAPLKHMLMILQSLPTYLKEFVPSNVPA